MLISERLSKSGKRTAVVQSSKCKHDAHHAHVHENLIRRFTVSQCWKCVSWFGRGASRSLGAEISSERNWGPGFESSLEGKKVAPGNSRMDNELCDALRGRYSYCIAVRSSILVLLCEPCSSSYYKVRYWRRRLLVFKTEPDTWSIERDSNVRIVLRISGLLSRYSALPTISQGYSFYQKSLLCSRL